MEDIIKEAQSVLNNGGNIIKTRDDRELILVDKDGKIQNAASVDGCQKMKKILTILCSVHVLNHG